MSTALIVVDVQNDFLPGGALAVPDGDEVIAPIIEFGHNALVDVVVMTQDWHDADHVGHRRAARGETPTYTDGDWPVHCVAGLSGANIAFSLRHAFNDAPVFRKGTDRDAEAYSAFAGKLGDIGLDDYFRAEGVDQVFVAGLALDFCVRQTALDAFGLGYHTTVLADATRPVTYLGGVLTGANFGRYQGNGLEVDTVEAVLEP